VNELMSALQRLNGLYTQRYNRRHKKDGALFRGRYKSVLVDKEFRVERKEENEALDLSSLR